MIDKKSELDSKIYCGDALFGNLSTIQSKNNQFVCVSNLNFIKMEHRNKLILRTHWRNPQNERVSSAKFQEQERSKLFFISLKAGGVGLNIKASYVLFLDPWWNFCQKRRYRAIALDS
jgi:non-specific serine/threonine protein kinase